jgi:hypothetical protein
MIPVALLLLLAARWPEATSLPNVEEFHNQMLRRFSDGRGFGMSRIMIWSTLGRHFRAPIGAKVDFKAENATEAQIITDWTRDDYQTGLYVFGASVASEPASTLDHRALKGPGVLNDATPRNELPKWAEVYPVAVEAIRRFERGASSHTTQLNGWTLHARPVVATKQACVECHTKGPAWDGLVRLSKFVAEADGTYKEVPPPPAPEIRIGDTLGGVIYMYRR